MFLFSGCHSIPSFQDESEDRRHLGDAPVFPRQLGVEGLWDALSTAGEVRTAGVREREEALYQA